MLKVNEYGERQAKGNEKNLCFKGWETLVILLIIKCICFKEVKIMCVYILLTLVNGIFFKSS